MIFFLIPRRGAVKCEWCEDRVYEGVLKQLDIGKVLAAKEMKRMQQIG